MYDKSWSVRVLLGRRVGQRRLGIYVLSGVRLRLSIIGRSGWVGRRGGELLVKRRVRAKSSGQALKRTRRKYPGLVVTGVNWLPDSPERKGEKLYQVKAHRRMRK